MRCDVCISNTRDAHAYVQRHTCMRRQTHTLTRHSRCLCMVSPIGHPNIHSPTNIPKEPYIHSPKTTRNTLPHVHGHMYTRMGSPLVLLRGPRRSAETRSRLHKARCNSTEQRRSDVPLDKPSQSPSRLRDWGLGFRGLGCRGLGFRVVPLKQIEYEAF